MAFDPITAGLEIGNKLIDHFFPNKEEADAAKQKLLELQQSGELAKITAQTDINKVEAASPNLFIAGWRPFVGWACGCAFIYSGLLGPIVAQVFHVPMVPIDSFAMVSVLGGLLGLGSMRTVEKIKGVSG